MSILIYSVSQSWTNVSVEDHILLILYFHKNTIKQNNDSLFIEHNKISLNFTSVIIFEAHAEDIFTINTLGYCTMCMILPKDQR